jgi:UDP-glucose 4-epimerase
MRIAVVGGAGFVGRHLSLALLKRSHEVLVYDNLSARGQAGEQAWLKPFQFAHADLLDRPRLQSELASFRPELIYHLAALHYIPYCDLHPEETLQVNVAGTLTLMLASERLPQLRGLVFASSVAVYPPTDGYHSETGPAQPSDIYGLSKLLGEQIVNLYARKYGVSHIAARLANIYGPDETNSHVIPAIVDQLLAGADILHLGRTDPCRDFLYVEDLAEGLAAAIPFLLREEIHETVNLGPGEEWPVQEAIDILCQLSGRDVRCVTDQDRLRPVERMHLRARVEHAREWLGWTPRHDLRAGLEKTFAWERTKHAPVLATAEKA